MIYGPLEQWILHAHRSVELGFRPDVVSVIESSNLSTDAPSAQQATLTRGFQSDGSSLQPLNQVPSPTIPYICFRWDPATNTAVVEEVWAGRYGAGWELTFSSTGEVISANKAWVS